MEPPVGQDSDLVRIDSFLFSLFKEIFIPPLPPIVLDRTFDPNLFFWAINFLKRRWRNYFSHLNFFFTCILFLQSHFVVVVFQSCQSRLWAASTASDTGPDVVSPGQCISACSWGSSSLTDVELHTQTQQKGKK
jgi:hypothetical protein